MNPTIEIQNSFLRGRLLIVDRLQNSDAVWELSAVSALARSFVTSAPEKRLLLYATAYRLAKSSFLRERVETQLSPWLEPSHASIWRKKKIGWKRLQPQVETRTLEKTIILKSPTADGEKGVLYLSFEQNWLRLIEHHDLPRLLREYLLVVASSWSPADFPSHWALAHIGPDPIFLQISNPSDMEMHQRFHHNIRPLPLMASDWINPEFYDPRPQGKREIDILMVAGWSRVKRHWLLFRTLRKMRRNLRVVLIGQDSDGRTADDVWAEAKAFGIADQIEMIRDAPIALVTEQQCNSKISIVLSAREGSCVAVTESFFAGAPVGMMQNAHIGSRRYINRQTGALLLPETMAAQLSELIEEREFYSPRAWAMANITCFQSTKTLNSILRTYCREHRIPWNRDIVPFCWRPDPVYVKHVDAMEMAPSYHDLYEHHGIVVAGHNVPCALEFPA